MAGRRNMRSRRTRRTRRRQRGGANELDKSNDEQFGNTSYKPIDAAKSDEDNAKKVEVEPVMGLPDKDEIEDFVMDDMDPNDTPAAVMEPPPKFEFKGPGFGKNVKMDPNVFKDIPKAGEPEAESPQIVPFDQDADMVDEANPKPVVNFEDEAEFMKVPDVNVLGDQYKKENLGTRMPPFGFNKKRKKSKTRKKRRVSREQTLRKQINKKQRELKSLRKKFSKAKRKPKKLTKKERKRLTKQMKAIKKRLSN